MNQLMTTEKLLKELEDLKHEHSTLKTLYEQDVLKLLVTEEAGKVAEQGMKASEIRYRRLFESAKDGILILDAETGKIVDVNPFLIELLGYSREKFIEKTIWEIGFFKDILANKDKFLELQQEGYVRYEDLPLETTDGRKINVEFVSNVYLVNHKPVIQCNIRDISTRKTAEEEIRRANKELKKINMQKDKLFSIIAHDLRSPFQGLIGLTEIMSSGDTDLSNEKISEYSHLLNESLVNLYRLLENLLAWAQFQKGSLSFNPQYINLSAVFSQCQDSVKQKALQKELTIINNISGTQLIYADVKMVSSVLRNLLSNATKFTRKNGRISATAKNAENGMIEISIADTGVGIPQIYVPELFTLDNKVSSLGTDDEPSSGLGLLLCKEFIEKHGGQIWVESREEDQLTGEAGGSVFHFTLPASPPVE